MKMNYPTASKRGIKKYITYILFSQGAGILPIDPDPFCDRDQFGFIITIYFQL